MNEEDIFLKALDLESADERSAYLDEACGRENELRLRIEALLARHADASRFMEQPAVEVMAEKLGSETRNAPHSTVGVTAPGPVAPALDFLGSSEYPDALGRLGQYEILDVIGWGGMGIVLKAQDTKLNRIVAVKVLDPELATNPTARKRFSREAQAAAAISHDHVVTIHAVHENHDSQAGQLPYLVMEFIDGESLQEKIDREGHLELKEILRIGRQIAAGLAAAHQQGLIHRDIKPSNILLQHGVQRVEITDFGLARAVDDVGMTHPGEVTGTPQYMSPEQALGQRVDARSDLFSLGSVLYAMCIGRSPFRADSSVASLRRVCDESPRAISEINPEIPDWLIAIIDRLLEKDAGDRIQSAEEVALLLEKHLAHLQDPVSSPFPGTAPAVQRRQTSRHRQRWLIAGLVLAGLCASLGVTEATGVTNFSESVIRIVKGEGMLVIEVDDPSVSVSIDGADIVITGAGPKEVRLTAGSYKVTATKDGRPVTQELVTITRRGRRVVHIFSEPPHEAALRPHSERLAELGRRVEKCSTFDPFDSELVKLRRDLVVFRQEHYAESEAIEAAQLMSRLSWPVDTLNREDVEPLELKAAGDGDAKLAPQELVAVLGHSRLHSWVGVYAVAFAPDGTLHSASSNGVLRQWDLQTGELAGKATQHGVYPAQTTFSGDCKKAAVMSGGELRLVDRTVGTTRTIKGIQHASNLGLSWSPDGKTIAKGNADGTITLFDFETGSVTSELSGHEGIVRTVVFSPDGTALASTGRDGTVRWWPLDGGEPRVFSGHTHYGLDVAFTSDGNKLVSASEDRTLRVWSIADGKCLHVLTGHTSPVHAVAIAANEPIVASTSADGTIKTWDFERGTQLKSFGVRGWTRTLEVSPDGKRLAQIQSSNVIIWDLNTGTVVHAWNHGERTVFSTAVSIDGRLIAFAGAENHVPLFDVARQKLLRRLVQPDTPGTRVGFTSVAFTDDTTSIVAAERTGIVRIWDRSSGRLQATLDANLPDQIFAMALSPDATRLAACGPNVYVWNLEATTLLYQNPARTSVTAAAFTPDAKTLVTGGQDHQIRLWDVNTGRLTRTLAGHSGRVMSVAVSPDGRQIASVAFDQQMRLWDLPTGASRISLNGHQTDGIPDTWGQFASVAYSPDGSRLASSAYDGTVRFWDPLSAAEIKSIRLCPSFGIISHLMFTPDGRHLLTANGNGTVYVLRLASRPTQANNPNEKGN